MKTSLLYSRSHLTSLGTLVSSISLSSPSTHTEGDRLEYLYVQETRALRGIRLEFEKRRNALPAVELIIWLTYLYIRKKYLD